MMGAWRPKHVEWLCRNKTCTVLHQVGCFIWPNILTVDNKRCRLQGYVELTEVNKELRVSMRPGNTNCLYKGYMYILVISTADALCGSYPCQYKYESFVAQKCTPFQKIPGFTLIFWQAVSPRIQRTALNTPKSIHVSTAQNKDC